MEQIKITTIKSLNLSDEDKESVIEIPPNQPVSTEVIDDLTGTDNNQNSKESQ